MSEDARSSLYLWLGALALFGSGWASIHLGILDGVSDGWKDGFIAALILLFIGQLMRWAWRRWRGRGQA